MHFVCNDFKNSEVQAKGSTIMQFVSIEVLDGAVLRVIIVDPAG